MKENNKKKLLLFDLAGPNFPGGCEKYFANLAKYLSKNNEAYFIRSTSYNKFMDYVYFLLFRRGLGTIKEVERDIGNTKVIDLGFLSFIPFTKTRKQTLSLLSKIDGIYSKNEFQELLSLFLLLGRKQYSKKVIVGVHTPIFIPNSVKGIWKKIHDFEYYSFLYKIFISSAKMVHVNNKDYKSLIHNKYGVSLEKIKFLKNPIDWKTQFIEKTENQKFTIVWAGRLTAQKGIDRLEKLILSLSKESFSKKIKIIIAGAGEEEPKVKGISEKYPDLVEFVGFVNPLDSLYKNADLSIFTAYFDTFAHAVLEPQSYGIPVISYNIAGPKDIIIQGKTGYLVNNNKDFCLKIKSLYLSKEKNKKEYENFKKNIYLTTNKNYSKTDTFSELEKYMKE